MAGTAAIEQDELGKCVHFENTVTFLLPFDPVVAKNAKAKGMVQAWVGHFVSSITLP